MRFTSRAQQAVDDFVRDHRPTSILRRASTPEEFANMVVYLSSPQGRPPPAPQCPSTAASAAVPSDGRHTTGRSALENRLRQVGVVPVVTIGTPPTPQPWVLPWCRGGLPIAEITFRTDAAADAIRLLRDGHPDFLVGAGTVLDVPTLRPGRSTPGPSFIVAPGFNPVVVDRCLRTGYPGDPRGQLPHRDRGGTGPRNLSC